MPAPAPAPRLPIEPAQRPLYQQPARVGCSGVSLVSVITLLAFLFFLRVIAPSLTERIAAIELPAPLRAALDQPTATVTTTTAVLGDDATPLPAPQLTPTLTAAPEPTNTEIPAAAAPTQAPTPPPVAATDTPGGPEYVVVANTGGTGVYLRADPRQDGKRLIALTDKTLLMIVGPDNNSSGQVWRNVRTTKDNQQTGWVLAQYLAPATGP